MPDKGQVAPAGCTALSGKFDLKVRGSDWAAFRKSTLHQQDPPLIYTLKTRNAQLYPPPQPFFGTAVQ
jgi:hypothetical protein